MEAPAQARRPGFLGGEPCLSEVPRCPHAYSRSRILTRTRTVHRPPSTVHRKTYIPHCHRAPWSRAARGQKNNRLVWDETVHIMHELFDAVWGDKHTVEIDNATELTVPVRPVLLSSRSWRA